MQCRKLQRMLAHTIVLRTVKVVEALAAKGDFEELAKYTSSTGATPDYMFLLQSLMMSNPDAAVNLAKLVAKQPGPPIDLNSLTDLFLQRNMVREATAFLLDVLQDDDPRNAVLQTKVSRNLRRGPLVCTGLALHVIQLLAIRILTLLATI